MNEFKENLKLIRKDDRECLKEYITKQIDEEISAEVARTLFQMMNNSDNPNRRKQILGRMLNINKLFREGFDKQMEKLKELEKDEKQQ